MEKLLLPAEADRHGAMTFRVKRVKVPESVDMGTKSLEEVLTFVFLICIIYTYKE